MFLTHLFPISSPLSDFFFISYLRPCDEKQQDLPMADFLYFAASLRLFSVLLILSASFSCKFMRVYSVIVLIGMYNFLCMNESIKFKTTEKKDQVSALTKFLLTPSADLTCTSRLLIKFMPYTLSRFWEQSTCIVKETHQF